MLSVRAGSVSYFAGRIAASVRRRMTSACSVTRPNRVGEGLVPRSRPGLATTPAALALRRGVAGSSLPSSLVPSCLSASSSSAAAAYSSSSEPSPSDMKYQYPNRDERPVVSRTLATEAAAAAAVATMPTPDDENEAASLSSSSSSSSSSTWYPDDRFDDSGSLPEPDRIRTLELQRSQLQSRPTVDPSMRITPAVPTFVPLSAPGPASLGAPDTEITTLDNGMRIASRETYGQVCTVGVLANCGSRYETPGWSTGANHVLELLAFRSTDKFGTASDIVERMDAMGGATFASSSREQMLFCVDVLRPNAESAVDILAETVLRPRLTEEEVLDAKRIVEFQSLDMMPEVRMGEGLQMAAYGSMPAEGTESGGWPAGNGGKLVQQLGKPHFCPLDALPNLNAQTLRDFRSANLLIPSEMVICGAGIAHPELVDLATRYFSDVPDADNPNAAPNASSSSSSSSPKSGRFMPSKYTGGEYRLPVKTIEGHTHVALAFEVGGWHSPDLVPTCVLQTLLGGGNSFSAGGPGKGMYSRLYREVLNLYRWAESAEAFTSFHTESGLLGITASSKPDKSPDAVRVIAEHMHKLATTLVTDEELERARNMLKCNVLTQLESRLVLFEDIGRQILTYGKREDAETMCKRIEGVTKEQIRDIAHRAIYGAAAAEDGNDKSTRPYPTLSMVGDDISKVPSVSDVASWFR